MKSKNAFRIAIIVSVMTLGMMDMSFGGDEYPARAITIINPFAPGGILDVVGRAYATVAQKSLGVSIVVVNKPGATGMVGGLEGAQAVPDGYTLNVISTTHTVTIEWEVVNGRNPAFTRSDHIPIGSFVKSSSLLVVPYESPWKTLSDMIKDCKAKPRHYAFSSGGFYGGSHLPAEILMSDTGINCRHVPYKGGGPALTAVVGKHVDFATQYPPSSIPLARGKKLRILAVLGPQRLKAIPEVPAAPELGLGPFQYIAWIGIFAPKGTPAQIVEKLRKNAAEVARDNAFIDMIENAGDEVQFMGGEELLKYREMEAGKIREVLKRLLAAEVRK